jgi:hypothetical protein
MGRTMKSISNGYADVKLLRVCFHRVFLAMTGAKDEYYDYFTAGNPIRRVKEPVPDS